jgi:hypothetical protein
MGKIERMLAFKKKSALLIIIAFACLLSGCQSNVQVKPLRDFPSPLVDQLPTRLGVYYSPEFQNYLYNEATDEQGAGEKTIDLGAAQMSMFQALLPSLFSQVEVVQDNTPESFPSHLEAILIPEIVDFEFSIPRLSRANVYEVWIKYRFQLLANDGSSIAVWTLPAYGKTPTAFMKSGEEALNLASVMALRDCGAGFVTGFEKVPEIAAWLNGNSGDTVPNDQKRERNNESD